MLCKHHTQQSTVGRGILFLKTVDGPERKSAQSYFTLSVLLGGGVGVSPPLPSSPCFSPLGTASFGEESGRTGGRAEGKSYLAGIGLWSWEAPFVPGQGRQGLGLLQVHGGVGEQLLPCRLFRT